MTRPTAKQVAALRHGASMTAEEFGALVYVTAPTVYGWEAGRRNCPAAEWELLRVYFGLAKPRTKGAA